MSRDQLIGAFLARHGYADARAEPLPGDASLRRYVRLSGGPRPALLMDAPPPEDIRPFISIAEHLDAAGIRVPMIFAAEPETGLLLEEDLGDCLLANLVDGGATDLPGAFDTAIDVLVRTHCSVWQTGHLREGVGGGGASAVAKLCPLPLSPSRKGRGNSVHRLPLWDAPTMASTALATMFDWWWPAMFGSPAPGAARQDVTAALETMLAPVAAGPTGFVHRDYFAGNLLWLPDRTIAVIDFQGAAIGHPAYDLASLLQDSRRDIPAAL